MGGCVCRACTLGSQVCLLWALAVRVCIQQTCNPRYRGLGLARTRAICAQITDAVRLATCATSPHRLAHACLLWCGVVANVRWVVSCSVHAAIY